MTAVGFANAKAPGYEADDFLAAAVAAEEQRGGRVLVASGDRDTFQLASETTAILFPVRAGEMARIGPAHVHERYRVDPKQVPDFIALRGDPSDKIPGARGVGPKGAADLLRRYRSLDAILTAGLFPIQAQALRAISVHRDNECLSTNPCSSRPSADLVHGLRSCPEMGA
jgi:5'-3' exonuclease